MRKALVSLAVLVSLGCAIWFLVLDMQTKFLIVAYLRTGLGWSRVLGAQDHLTVRFDYDISGAVEAARAKKVMEYFRSILPDKDLWYALEVDKVGSTYRVFFPVKQGIENDFVMMLQMRSLVNDMSSKVFDGGRVDLHLCDGSFNTLRVVPTM